MTKLQQVREKKGLSVYQLAKDAGIKITTITNIEKGVTNLDKIQLGTIKKLSKALGVEINEIID